MIAPNVLTRQPAFLSPVLSLIRAVFHGLYNIRQHRILSVWRDTGRLVPKVVESPMRLYNEECIMEYVKETIVGVDIATALPRGDPIVSVR